VEDGKREVDVDVVVVNDELPACIYILEAVSSSLTYAWSDCMAHADLSDVKGLDLFFDCSL
jgi:uncharacterized protein involved in tolerance to divalent cations